MSTIDIRTEQRPVTEIIFGAPTNNHSTQHCFKLTKEHRSYDGLAIQDSNEFVLVDTKERAENLIKALQKAVELEWVK